MAENNEEKALSNSYLELLTNLDYYHHIKDTKKYLRLDIANLKDMGRGEPTSPGRGSDTPPEPGISNGIKEEDRATGAADSAS